MKIQKTTMVELSALEFGECFAMKDEWYLKTDRVSARGDFEVVHLVTGSLSGLHRTTRVTLINLTVQQEKP